MFKELGGKLERRIKTLEKTNALIKNLEDVLRVFFLNRGISPLPVEEIVYSPKTQSCIVKITNKAIANEAALHLDELTDEMKKRQVRITRIIIQ